MLNFPPKWHDPSHDELSFANELLQFHFQSALEDLLTICQTKVHSETGIYASSGHGNNLAIHFFDYSPVMSCVKEKKNSRCLFKYIEVHVLSFCALLSEVAYLIIVCFSFSRR